MNDLYIDEFLKTGFDLKEHLALYLNLNKEELESRLSSGIESMKSLHPSSFTEEDASGFYEDKVGTAHLFDLAAWHLGSSEYIADTLRLETMYAHGNVLDFGGGIGTHSIAAAYLKEVEHVYFVDLNPQNRDFVLNRAEKLGLSKLISVHRDIPCKENLKFDTVICLDVLEHLPKPDVQLIDFLEISKVSSVLLLNWYFFKGYKGEYPFHFDDKDMIENFFLTLQQNFLEIFHPFLITARCYKPLTESYSKYTK